MKKWRLGNAGVTSVEFGLMLPLLLFLFFGVIEVARLQVTYVAIERVLMDMSIKARLAMGDISTTSLLNESVSDKLSPLADADDLTVTWESADSFPLLLTSPDNGPGGEGDVVRLEIKASLGLLDWLWEGGFTTEHTFVIYYINEANSYWSVDD